MKRWKPKRIILASLAAFLLASLLTLQFIPQQYVFRFIRTVYATDITQLIGLTGNIGKEDVEWGSGLDTDTFTVPSHTTGTVTLTKLPSLYANIASIIKGKWYVSTDTIANHADNSIAGSLAWIVTQLAGSTATIELPPNTYTFGGNYTFPVTVGLDAQFGAIIVTGGNTITINGPWQSGLWKSFTASAGNVVFGPRSTDLIRFEWFGAVGDATGETGVGTDNASAVQIGLQCMADSDVPVVVPPTALYRMASGASLVGTVAFQYSRLAIYGPHRGRYGIQQAEDFSTLRGGFYKDFYGGHLINLVGFSVVTKDRSPIISGLVFLGNRANDSITQEEYALLRIENTNDGTIENCHFSDHLGYGFRLVNAGDITIKACVFVRLGSTTKNAASLAVTGGELEDEVLLEKNASNWITLENNRWENGYYHEIDIIGDSDDLMARDIFMNDCKVHGRSATTPKEEGPLMYVENAKKIYIQNTMFGNSSIACLHFVDVEPVFLVNVSLGGTWEKIIAEGTTTVYFTSGYTGPPHSKFIYVADQEPRLSFITAASPTEITYPAHGLNNGDWVFFDGIVQAVWATALNYATAGFFQVSNVTTNTFTVPVNSALFVAYTDLTGKLFWRLFKVGTGSRLYMEQSVYVFGQTRWGDFKLLPGRYDGTFKCNSQSTTRNYIWDSTLELAKASAPAHFIYGRVLGEPYPRVRLSNNHLAFGPGTATYDVQIQRGAAGIMEMDAGDKLRSDRFELRGLVAEPASVTSGDMVYANGTDWDPGSGAGFYFRQGANWKKVTAGVGTWENLPASPAAGDQYICTNCSGAEKFATWDGSNWLASDGAVNNGP